MPTHAPASPTHWTPLSLMQSIALVPHVDVRLAKGGVEQAPSPSGVASPRYGSSSLASAGPPSADASRFELPSPEASAPPSAVGASAVASGGLASSSPPPLHAPASAMNARLTARKDRMGPRYPFRNIPQEPVAVYASSG